MLICCWSSKGGAGATVVAAALARRLAADREGGGALLADLAGDAPVVLGLTEPAGPGLAGWLAAGSRGRRSARWAASRWSCRRASGCWPAVTGRSRTADGPTCSPRCWPPTRAAWWSTAGAPPRSGPHLVAAAADRSVLVTRACFLAVRRR